MFDSPRNRYHSRITTSTLPDTMRLFVTAALILPLLAACAGKDNSFALQQVPQTGTLKVHPDLVGTAQAEQKAPNSGNDSTSR